MEQTQETATSYYNPSRKRSFFYSRLFVVVSMFVLVIMLGINISVLYSEQRTSTTSQAASANNQTNLPELPKGCAYESKEKGFIVVCPTAIPEATPTIATNPKFPITVDLPELPALCDYVASGAGLAVKCTSPTAVIPTVAVKAVPSCVAGIEPNTLLCSDAANEKVTIPLPPLPEGCTYQLVAKDYFVSCNALSDNNN